MATKHTAAQYLKRLKEHQSDAEQAKIRRYFKSGKGDYAEGDRFIGVRMGDVFALSKGFVDMPADQIEKLLESPIHEARAGAVSIMDKDCRRKGTDPGRRKELYELYMRRHDRINNWDLVDLGAPFVVGGYLYDRSRTPLYRLARSRDIWKRRTAIVSTAYFIRQGDYEDTFKIAQTLLGDTHDLIHKAVGGWVREAGKHDPARLTRFLDAHAARMPPTILRYATEKLEPKARARYRAISK